MHVVGHCSYNKTGNALCRRENKWHVESCGGKRCSILHQRSSCRVSYCIICSLNCCEAMISNCDIAIVVLLVFDTSDVKLMISKR